MQLTSSLRIVQRIKHFSRYFFGIVGSKLTLTVIFLLIFSRIPNHSSNNNYFAHLYSSLSIENIEPEEWKDKNFFLRNPYPSIGYQEITPVADIQNLKMIGFENKFGVWGRTEEEQLHGMILRCLRFQNVSHKVEQRYHLPENLLLAMIMNETGGVEFLPNGRDDGGLGLCHLQPYIARQFNLKTLDNCKELRSKSHGKKLRYLIGKHNHNYTILTKYDDRFHILLNLDAVARILRYYMAREEADDPIEMAVSYYGGIDKFPFYYQKINRYRSSLNDSEFVSKVTAKFDSINPDLLINGKMSGFKEYIEYYHARNLNFGLEKYE